MSVNRLEIRGISKSFPGVRALDNIDLTIKPGVVHAIVGENGAGKSTLMKCLFGIYKPDKGKILIDGSEAIIDSPGKALQLGIAMIHQELNPIPFRNIMDNIWVGRFPTSGVVVDEVKMRQKTKALFESLDFDINPDTLARKLSISQLQAVEIAKAISYDTKIIIMDEPTSSLTDTETGHLFKLIRKLKHENRSIIYISHKLEEIFEIADEITVLRDGKNVGVWKAKEIQIEEVIKKMVGRTMQERFPARIRTTKQDLLLEVDSLSSADRNSFSDISFCLYKGEILGIGGLVGAQRTELIESLFGLHKIAKGSIRLNGKEIKNRNPEEAIQNRFALLTEDRRATGIVPMLSVEENTLTVAYKKIVKNFPGFFRPQTLKTTVKEICTKLNIRTPSLETQIRNLSGGNQQKVLIGRWLLAESKILILDEPTRGIDVGSKYEIYKIMQEFVENGASILMVSSEMPELLGMSDRILVMCAGKLTGTLNHSNASQVEVMKLATAFTLRRQEESR